MTLPKLMVEQAVLLSPDPVARAAALMANDPAERWMLSQPRSVRASFVHEAWDGDDRAQMIWMLRQSDQVRESYVREVVEAGGVPADDRDQTVWMLRQPDAVRESFLRDVLHAPPAAASSR
jgi:hypothetical protein